MLDILNDDVIVVSILFGAAILTGVAHIIGKILNSKQEEDNE
jgi:hypothetical protein